MASVKLAFVFLVFTAILALPAIARIAPAPTPDPFTPKDFPLLNCTAFITQGTTCIIDVMTNPVAPHPPCCKAISNLNDCDPEFFKSVPDANKALIKGICSLWGV